MDSNKKEYIEKDITSQIYQLNVDLNNKDLWDKNEVGCSSSYMKEVKEDE